jgi:opacity protein-like surface antigen
MSRFTPLLLALGLSLASVRTLADQQPAAGPYVAVGVGGDWVDRSSLSIFGTSVESRWATGWGGFAAAGYRFPFGLRLEVEGSGRDDQVHAFNQNPWFGTQWDTSLLANLLYDIGTFAHFTPYLGGGLGMSHISWGNNFRADLRAIPYVYDDSGTEFAWQAIVGVAYQITDRMAITLDGRYKGSNGYSFRASGPASADISDFDYKTRSLFLGFRYSFD